MLVNEEFKQEIRRSFKNCYEESLTSSSGPSRWTIKEKTQLNELNEAEFFVLTVSSQLFRVFILMHFTKSPATEAYVAEVLKINSNSVDDDKFYDYLGELGNAFCGSVKRDVGKIVPSLGMSTPNRLNKDCLKYIDQLHTDFGFHAVAEYDNSPLFYASIYLSADEELNLKVNTSQLSNDDDVDSGDLEFF
ncbi:MAG: hypothetical protein ACI84K_000741 [Pseudohongiellaceae bacterium]|jgi:hypothetical protein